jgi:hypothetical protein
MLVSRRDSGPRDGYARSDDGARETRCVEIELDVFRRSGIREPCESPPAEVVALDEQHRSAVDLAPRALREGVEHLAEGPGIIERADGFDEARRVRQVSLVGIRPRSLGGFGHVPFGLGLCRRELRDDYLFGLCRRGAPKRVHLGAQGVDFRFSSFARLVHLAFVVLAHLVTLRIGAPLHVVHLRRSDAAGILNLAHGVTARVFHVGMGRAPHLVELRLKGFSELGDLRFGGSLDVIGLFLRGVPKLLDVRFRLPPHLGRSRFGRLLRGTRPLFASRSHQVVGEGAKVGLKVGVELGRCPVERGSNLLVERHGFQYCT